MSMNPVSLTLAETSQTQVTDNLLIPLANGHFKILRIL